MPKDLIKYICGKWRLLINHEYVGSFPSKSMVEEVLMVMYNTNTDIFTVENFERSVSEVELFNQTLNL